LKLGDLVERALVRVTFALIALLARLPHGFVLACFRRLADVAVALGIRQRVVMQNLDLVFGEEMSVAEKRRIARSATRNLLMTLAEMARSSHPRARDEVADTLVFDPPELMDDFAADPRGTLFAVAHSGNFDLCGLRFVTRYGRGVAVVMKPLGTPRFNDALIGARESYGFEVIRTDGGDVVAQSAERLRTGRHVCVLPDQFARRSGIVVDFMGVPASTHAGPALAVLRAPGSRLCIAVDTRVDDGARHVCRIVEITDFTPTGDAAEDVRALTARIADAMGDFVRKYPESYLWHHRRWRSRGTPSGSQSSRSASIDASS
jgi:lauroyl/myristoyl acyltransferase